MGKKEEKVDVEEEAPAKKGCFPQKKKKEEDIGTVPLTQLFRYASGRDRFYLFLGCLGGFLNGAVFPLFALIFGSVFDSFNSSDLHAMYNSINEQAVWFVVLGLFMFVVQYMQFAYLKIAAEAQVRRIRRDYLAAILRQEQAWFDRVGGVGAITARLTGDTTKMAEGIGEKIGVIFRSYSCVIFGFGLGLYKGWQLALVIMSIGPLLGGAAGVMMTLVGTMGAKGQQSYAEAGAVATENLSAIRTVASFNGERKAIADYSTFLVKARKEGIKKGIVTGLGMGVTMFLIFCTYAIGLWYGGVLVLNNGWTAGRVLTVFFCIIMGAFNLGQATPPMTALRTAQGAAFVIFQTLDRQSRIDALSPKGKKLKKVKGRVELKDVTFRYPTRPDNAVFHNVSLTIEPGEKVAFVGPSGAGKSTCISLIQRFYDPEEGSVEIDGHDIRKLNVKNLREHIGIVSQEPVLFSGTIAENISYGVPDASMEEIEAAAEAANAHRFIRKWKEGYNTQVGERGAKLSGGQKQRVAIARAILKNPSILLLDEATSALDTKSEKVVQDALNRVMQGRTTIVVAHRLATIQDVDRIYVINNGGIEEQGTYNELYELGGTFRHLLDLQGMGAQAAPGEVIATSAGLSQSQSKTTRSEQHSSLTKVEEEEEYPVTWGRIFGYNAPETPYFLIGIFGSILLGIAQPVFSIVFSEVLTVLYASNSVTYKEDMGFWCGMFVVIGTGMLVGGLLQGWALGIMGEKLTERLRAKLFKSLIRHDPGWFDADQHQTGVLTAKLAEEAALVEGMMGGSLGIQIQNFASIVCALIIAFYYGWVMAFAVLACAPFMALGGAIEMLQAKGMGKKTQAAVEEANRVATEAVSQVRTVAAFTREATIVERFDAALAKPQQLGMRTGHTSGVFLAMGGALTFLSNSFIFWIGGYMVSKAGGTKLDSDSPAFNLSFADFNKVVMAIMMMAMTLGQTSTLAPDSKKAKAAASRIMKLIDDVPTVDALSKEGKVPKKVKGSIAFEEVEFSYPTRLTAPVLRGLSFTAKPGQTIALVGESGSGKSSCIQLLLRYYDVLGGRITVDGKDIRSLNPAALRRFIGLVGQEPVLFRGTIMDNIRYGHPDATEEEVIAAATAANAHKFISKFDDGYDTQVGERGSQLSGGQKQRIAIARAIVKNPPILLLDEATSALDTESEKKVQDALDKAAEGRTTVVIAHRLSTIRGADHIIVLQNGSVAEEGRHDELMALKSKYYNLVKRQTNEV